MKKRVALLLVFALVVSMFLVGCTTETPSVTPDVDATPEELVNNPGASRGNVLTIGGTNLNGVFNPITYSTAYDYWMIGAMFDALLYINEDGSLTTEGGLAEKYEVSEDGKEVIWYLRKGVKFHDGEELTAEDVAFTYDAIMRPDYQGRSYNLVRDIVGAEERKAGTADTVPGIEIVDDYTVKLTLTAAKATTLRNLNIMPLPKHYYDTATSEEMAALDRDPIGTGAFKVKEYVVEQYLELERFDDYWNGAAKLDGVIYKMVARTNELSEFEIGTIDAVNFENSVENYEIVAGFEHGELLNRWNNGYAYVAFNLNKPMFQDVRVRQALVYGVDRAGFVQSFFGDMGGAVAHAPISPVSWAFPESGLNEYNYDTAKANQLLDEAGWVMAADGWRYKDGEKLAINWKSYQEAEWAIKFPALAKENWKELGIDLEIELMDFNSLGTLVAEPANKDDWDMFNMAWGLTADPDMQSIFSKNTFPPGNNRGYYYNERVEELMEKGVLELDQAKRKEIYTELAHLFNEDLPYMFVYVRMNPWMVNKRVKNFNPTEFQYWWHNANQIEIITQ